MTIKRESTNNPTLVVFDESIQGIDLSIQIKPQDKHKPFCVVIRVNHSRYDHLDFDLSELDLHKLIALLQAAHGDDRSPIQSRGILPRKD